TRTNQLFGDRLEAIGPAAVGLAQRDAIALHVADHAGLDDFRPKVNDGPDHTARIDGCFDHASGVDALQSQSGEVAGDSLEVPPRNAVLRADNGGVLSDQRFELGSELREPVRFDADIDRVHRTGIVQIADDFRADLEIAVGAKHTQSALL